MHDGFASQLESTDLKALPPPGVGRATRVRRALLSGLAVVVLLGAGGAGYSAAISNHIVSTENAYVGADSVAVSPNISGSVAQVLIGETQTVSEGQVLLILDQDEAKIRVAQAQADYARTLQRVRQYFATEQSVAAQVEVSRATLVNAKSMHERRSRLLELGAISREAADASHTTYETARAGLRAAESNLRAQQEMIRGVRDPAQHPDALAAAAALASAELTLKRTTIRAPIAGVVSQFDAQIGKQVAPGQRLMTISPISTAYVDANFKEGELARVRPGQPVTLRSDIYGDQVVFRGRVAGLAGGTGSAFAMIPAQNATGNWIKVVQRVPVRISLDPHELTEHPLRVGMSMHAEIDVAGN